MSEGPVPRLLIVEDEAGLRDALLRYFQRRNVSVSAFANAEEAWSAIEGGLAFDLLLTDIRMPGAFNGSDLAARVKRLYPDRPVVLMTAYDDASLPDGCSVVLKPFSLAELLEALRWACPSLPWS